MPFESATAPRPPVEYSLDLVTEICARIAEGGYLKVICREAGKPHYTTFFRWLQAHPEAQELYRAARQMGGHWHADRIIEMCDEQPERVKDEKGAARIDSGWVQLQRVRIDALKWVASKWFPKEYGDKLDVTSGDKPLEAPVIPLRFPTGGPGIPVTSALTNGHDPEPIPETSAAERADSADADRGADPAPDA